ncbi:MAG: hypothetical protein ACFCGT_02420, partial [Sandaracinaceae bacterium]
MKRTSLFILPGILLSVVAVTALLGWRSGEGPVDARLEADDEAEPAARPGESAEALAERRRAARRAQIDRTFPLHGLVTGRQIQVHDEPDGGAPAIGWLRLGGRVRLKAEGRPRPGCASGWYEVAPRGRVCAGHGVEVTEDPPEA